MSLLGSGRPDCALPEPDPPLHCPPPLSHRVPHGATCGSRFQQQTRCWHFSALSERIPRLLSHCRVKEGKEKEKSTRMRTESILDIMSRCGSVFFSFFCPLERRCSVESKRNRNQTGSSRPRIFRGRRPQRRRRSGLTVVCMHLHSRLRRRLNPSEPARRNGIRVGAVNAAAAG